MYNDFVLRQDMKKKNSPRITITVSPYGTAYTLHTIYLADKKKSNYPYYVLPSSPFDAFKYVHHIQ